MNKDLFWISLQRVFNAKSNSKLKECDQTFNDDEINLDSNELSSNSNAPIELPLCLSESNYSMISDYDFFVSLSTAFGYTAYLYRLCATIFDHPTVHTLDFSEGYSRTKIIDQLMTEHGQPDKM